MNFLTFWETVSYSPLTFALVLASAKLGLFLYVSTIAFRHSNHQDKSWIPPSPRLAPSGGSWWPAPAPGSSCPGLSSSGTGSDQLIESTWGWKLSMIKWNKQFVIDRFLHSSASSLDPKFDPVFPALKFLVFHLVRGKLACFVPGKLFQYISLSSSVHVFLVHCCTIFHLRSGLWNTDPPKGQYRDHLVGQLTSCVELNCIAGKKRLVLYGIEFYCMVLQSFTIFSVGQHCWREIKRNFDALFGHISHSQKRKKYF